MNSNYTVKFIQIKFYSVNSNHVLMFSILWRLLILNLFLIIYMFKGRLNFIVKYVHSWSFSIGFLIPHLSISFLHLLYVCVILFFKNWVCVCFCVRLYFQISLSLSLSLFFNLFKCFSLFRFPIISVYALSPLFKFISLSFFGMAASCQSSPEDF